jgi:hypothetical protein
MNIFKTILVLMLGLALLGCGKKVWPEPDADGEKFAISITSHEMQADCLELTAEISGNYKNLSTITLELEASEEPCPACPFLVTDSVVLPPGSPEIKRLENMLTITYCGLDPGRYYRARLKARNIYSIIREETSRVVIIQ